MRVVDEDGERLALVDGVETTGDTVDGFDAGSDRVVGDAERAGGSDRRKCVSDVEAAAQLELDSLESVVGVERERVRDLRGQAHAVVVVDVDDSDVRLSEQASLRL